jgi:hypothetical protein
MINVKLSNNQHISFPDDTSQSIIKSTVKRLMGIIEEPKIAEVFEELGDVLTKQKKIDFYGPAMKDQTSVVSGFFDFLKKDSKSKEALNTTLINTVEKSFSDLEDVLKKMISNVNSLIDERQRSSVDTNKILNQLIIGQHECVKAVHQINNTQLEINKGFRGIMDAQTEHNKVLNKLVDATKASKKVIRDKDGNITGVE